MKIVSIFPAIITKKDGSKVGRFIARFDNGEELTISNKKKELEAFNSFEELCENLMVKDGEYGKFVTIRPYEVVSDPAKQLSFGATKEPETPAVPEKPVQPAAPVKEESADHIPF